jgi:hypothetical protein
MSNERSDRRKLNLRGPVRSVRAELRGPLIASRIEEWEFDERGRCIRRFSRSVHGTEWARDFKYGSDCERLNPDYEIIRGEDGSRIEVQPLGGANGWTAEHLHGVAFSAADADVARTRFGPDGAPVETRFANRDGHVQSSLRYTCDDEHRVREVVQYVGDASSVSEQARAAFTYDEHGWLVESRAWIAGHLVRQSQHSYNELGDLVYSAGKDEPTVHVEYEYDQQMNWVKKRAYIPGGVDEEVREIAYF